MFLTTLSPTGEITSLDLDSIMHWRLELMQVAQRYFGIGIRYIRDGGATANAFLAAIDLGKELPEIRMAVEIGLPSQHRAGNKERFREALKVLVNAELTAKEVETTIARAGQLVDIYHDVAEALFGAKMTTQPLGQLGPLLSGEFGDWKYVLSTTRFGSFLDLKPPQIDGVEPETVVIPQGPPKPVVEIPKRQSRRLPPSMPPVPTAPAPGPAEPSGPATTEEPGKKPEAPSDQE